MNKRIIVIDLDGTFMQVNTFHQWMKFLLKEESKKLHFFSIMHILKIVLLRYLKFINHAKMKYDILKLSESSITQTQISTFVNSLHPYINQDILKILEDRSNITILATAAPKLYSDMIKEVYEFDYSVATPDTSHPHWAETIREEKKKQLLLLLETQFSTHHISLLYTDHHDDLPLMRLADQTCLINASQMTKELVRKENIKLCNPESTT